MAEIAWVAGVLEGEGYFGLIPKKTKSPEHYWEVRIQCNMTDEDVIRRLHELTGLGAVRGPLPVQKDHHKPAFSWTVNRRSEVICLLNQIRPWMGQRRKARIDDILHAHATGPHPKTWQHGTRQGYEKMACRCAPCTQSNTERHRTRRQRKVSQR